MKSVIFVALSLFVMLSVNANAQVSVPQQVKSAFSKEHIGVRNAKWERENGNFEGNWQVDGVNHSALYSPQGKFIMSESDIQICMLPEAARKYLGEQIHKKIKEASKNIDGSGTVTYEVDAKDNACIFDENGKFIKTAKGD